MGLKERRRKRRYLAFLRKSVIVFAGMILFGSILYLIYKPETKPESLVQEKETESESMIPIELVEKESEQIMSDTKETTEAVAVEEIEYQKISAMTAGEKAASGMVSKEIANRLFYSSEIDSVIFRRINGNSYTENENVTLKSLRYLKMLYYGGDGNTYVGEMIVNEKIAETVLEIFQTLYENQYPIERMVLVDEYQAEDELSMSENNTSAFNYRPIAGSSKLSKHSYGMAIDINPKYNPCVKVASDGTVICQPENGIDYIDRNKDFLYKIDENDLTYQLFTQAGFIWGGSWNSLKDYQHFEMPES